MLFQLGRVLFEVLLIALESRLFCRRGSLACPGKTDTCRRFRKEIAAFAESGLLHGLHSREHRTAQNKYSFDAPCNPERNAVYNAPS